MPKKPLFNISKRSFGGGFCAFCDREVTVENVKWVREAVQPYKYKGGSTRKGFTPACSACNVDAVFVSAEDALAYKPAVCGGVIEETEVIVREDGAKFVTVHGDVVITAYY